MARGQGTRARLCMRSRGGGATGGQLCVQWLSQGSVSVGARVSSEWCRRWHRVAAAQAVENHGSAVAADAGPAGVRLPEVEAQDTGVTQGGGGANRGGYTGLSDGLGGEEMK